jgi:hypothetical protein
MNQQIIDYLQQNKKQYTKDSLIAQLRKAGFDSVEIDEAVNFVYSAQLQTDAPLAPKNNIEYVSTKINCFAASLILVLYVACVTALIIGFKKGGGMFYPAFVIMPAVWPATAILFLPPVAVSALILYKQQRKYITRITILSIFIILYFVWELTFLWTPVRDWIRVDLFFLMPIVVFVFGWFIQSYFKIKKEAKNKINCSIIWLVVLLGGSIVVGVAMGMLLINILK